MTETTWIKNASYVVAWDGDEQRHVYLRDADVVFAGNAVTFVGKGYSGQADTIVDGHERMIMPGMVNVHTHLSTATKTKGTWEELGSPLMYMSTLFEYMSLIQLGAEAVDDFCNYALAELLKSGCTTVIDMHSIYPSWFDNLVNSGIRAYVAPGYASARYVNPDGHTLGYDWDEKAGVAGMKKALDIVDAAERHESDRLKGVVYPAQVDTCTPDLLRDSVAAARERDVPLVTHVEQSCHEFREIALRHGRTSVEFLSDLGFLGAKTILGHVIFTDQHSWIHQWPGKNDIRLLAESGTTVAHCPCVIMRRGILLESLQSYRDSGVNVGIGTDIYPHNMIEELRWANVGCKIAEGSQWGTSLEATFEAATVNGAKAFGRDDLGRLEAGSKADIVVVDLSHQSMEPARDPLACLVFTAAERPVKDVYVDGKKVVGDGEVLTIDVDKVASRLRAAQQKAFEGVPGRDWANRTADQAFPMSLNVKE